MRIARPDGSVGRSPNLELNRSVGLFLLTSAALSRDETEFFENEAPRCSRTDYVMRVSSDYNCDLVMADENQLKMIREDVDLWNAWRVEHADDKIDLSNADLERCDLILADLAGANLSGASLVMANLKAADLRGANLSNANLVGARMIGVDLVAANISGADLRTAEDLTTGQLEETQGDGETQLPDNVAPPAHWK